MAVSIFLYAFQHTTMRKPCWPGLAMPGEAWPSVLKHGLVLPSLAKHYQALPSRALARPLLGRLLGLARLRSASLGLAGPGHTLPMVGLARPC